MGTSEARQRMPCQARRVIARLAISGFSDKCSDLLTQDRLVTFAKSHVYGSDQAIAPNQVARRHSRHGEGPPRVARGIDGNRIIHGLSAQKVQRVLIYVVDANRDHLKILGSKFFIEAIQGGQ